MREALLEGRVRSTGTHRDGSWDPVNPWQGDGGRIHATSVAVPTLETCYRHARFAGR